MELSRKPGNVSFDLATFLAFLDRYEYNLPRTVKIVNGFCGTNDDDTLEANQIFVLYKVERQKVIMAIDEFCQEICVQQNSNFKVYLLPLECDIYTTVHELLTTQSPYILVLEDISSPEIVSGSRLKLLSDRGSIPNYLKCQVVDQDVPRDILLPLHLTGKFLPLLDCNDYFLDEALSQNQLPINVRFVSETTQAGNRVTARFLTNLGNIRLTHKTEVAMVFAASIDSELSLYMFPETLDMTVSNGFKVSAETSKNIKECRKALEKSETILKQLNSEVKGAFYFTASPVRRFSLKSLQKTPPIGSEEEENPTSQEDCPPPLLSKNGKKTCREQQHNESDLYLEPITQGETPPLALPPRNESFGQDQMGLAYKVVDLKNWRKFKDSPPPLPPKNEEEPITQDKTPPLASPPRNELFGEDQMGLAYKVVDLKDCRKFEDNPPPLPPKYEAGPITPKAVEENYFGVYAKVKDDGRVLKQDGGRNSYLEMVYKADEDNPPPLPPKNEEEPITQDKTPPLASPPRNKSLGQGQMGLAYKVVDLKDCKKFEDNPPLLPPKKEEEPITQDKTPPLASPPRNKSLGQGQMGLAYKVVDLKDCKKFEDNPPLLPPKNEEEPITQDKTPPLASPPRNESLGQGQMGLAYKVVDLKDCKKFEDNPPLLPPKNEEEPITRKAVEENCCGAYAKVKDDGRVLKQDGGRNFYLEVIYKADETGDNPAMKKAGVIKPSENSSSSHGTECSEQSSSQKGTSASRPGNDNSNIWISARREVDCMDAEDYVVMKGQNSEAKTSYENIECQLSRKASMKTSSSQSTKCSAQSSSQIGTSASHPKNNNSNNRISACRDKGCTEAEDYVVMKRQKSEVKTPFESMQRLEASMKTQMNRQVEEENSEGDEPYEDINYSYESSQKESRLKMNTDNQNKVGVKMPTKHCSNHNDIWISARRKQDCLNFEDVKHFLNLMKQLNDIISENGLL